MRSTITRGTLSLVTIGTLGGCAVAADPLDEPIDESATNYEIANPEAYTFFEIAKDLRKCAFPTCGGWFITRLNAETTRCHDGRTAASCYTPVLDWSKSGLNEAPRAALLAAAFEGATAQGVKAVVRGRFGRINGSPRPQLGRFVIDEAWTAANTATSDGDFVRVRDNGVRCFAPPCPSLTEMWLNDDAVTAIHGMDYSTAALDAYLIEECSAALQSADGMLTAGHRYSWTENEQDAIGRTASAVFMRLTNEPSP